MSTPCLIREGDRVINAETGEVIQTGAEQRARSKRTLELYGFNVRNPEPFVPFTPEELCPPESVNWHYHGVVSAIGMDKHGRDYEWSFVDGNIKRITSQNERGQITAYARTWGAAAASRKFRIPAPTIRQWIRRSA
jgi:hypothetical protein